MLATTDTGPLPLGGRRLDVHERAAADRPARARPYAWSIAWTGGNNFALAAEADPFAAADTTDGQIFTSSDNGATWTRAAGVVAATGVGRITVASAPSNRSVLYAVASHFGGDLADFFKSTDGGANWTALGATRLRVRYTNRNQTARRPAQLFNTQGWYDQFVAISPTNPNVVDFGGALHNARTTDGGATWKMTTEWLGRYGLPYVHADSHAAAYDAVGHLYFGTDGGIFKSTRRRRDVLRRAQRRHRHAPDLQPGLLEGRPHAR